MTVNELIAKLRAYASEGHGDQIVTVNSAVWDYDPVLEVAYVPDDPKYRDRGVVQLTSEYGNSQIL